MTAQTDANPPRPADRPVFVGLLLLLVWLPLPWGSHSGWAISAAGLITFGLLAAWCLMAMAGAVTLPRKERVAVAPLILWALWLAWIAVQAMPLSAEHLAKWSPQSLQMHQPIASLQGQPPVYSLSIAPGVTWAKWVESWLYFGLYLLAMLLVRSDRRLRLVLTTLLVSGLIQASYGSLMLMSGADFGWLRKKEFYLESATGTFVNQNHFAGYLEIAAAAGISLVLADLGGKGRRWSLRNLAGGLLELALSAKVRARAALILIALALVLSRSRMGNLAFFAAVSIGGIGYVLLRERTMFLKALLLFASVLAVDMLLIGERFGLERVIERIDTTRLEREGRIKLLSEIGPVVEAYALTGSGLGTFSMAYEPWRSEAMTDYMNHAHNDYVEFFIETGLIGTVLLGGLLLWHAMHAFRVAFRRRNRLKVAAAFAVLMAMLALGLHALAEFNFQIPAIAGSFVVLLGTIAACSDKSRRNKAEMTVVEDGGQAASPQPT